MSSSIKKVGFVDTASFIYELVTQSDVLEFISLASQSDGEVYIEDGSGKFRISGKSILGVKMASVEWNDLYAVYSDTSFSSKIYKFAKSE